ncbi:hypothetical protein CAPN001_15020 [Capnocytophaga stomatis]|uniref:TssN family type VI secretion system protein n=1 Tax=Capnocytophaga stomatis TaxID=1848904 RepID=A0A250FYY2_9FLAO|nr:TssN family type VI secretion system protein [Capnocytophaga stomatis]ATA90330.1 hypothetical protein CGC58_11665 [Capnocytophaga stomatis]GIJ94211.1 hypothetical protein CAPN002_14290 [Capnocytophaga stomatis]GIJ96933.1 hypothetical protein CAPN001_15020 [Capnocytophaga stomatis]GIM50603.1 hypothetical protein CAPN003_20550 [Capnocytophaga stomatis]
MNTFLQKLITSQLIIPIVTFLIAIVMMVVAKKQQLLSDKKAVLYILLTGVMFSSLGVLGYLQVDFMPYGYIGLQIFYLILGYFNYQLLFVYFKNLKRDFFGRVALILLIQIILSGSIFSFLFNLVNDFKYGVWASTCLLSLLVLPLFVHTVSTYLKIPVEIYKMKIYNPNQKGVLIPPIGNEGLLVYEIEIYKNSHDSEPTRLKAKSTKDMIFGDWFELILSDYNGRKFSAPIEYYDTENPYGWIFYTKPSFFLPRKYIDPDLSFRENKLSEKHVIVSKRVRKKEEVEETLL